MDKPIITKSEQSPLKYGDTVYYAYPQMNRKVFIAGLGDFEGQIYEYRVLFQVHNYVIVTSPDYVAKQVADRMNYWNETDDNGNLKNCSPHNFERAAVGTIWRDALFNTREEAIAYQKECIAEMHKSLDRFEEKLEDVT